jgi:ankyrin repeat protein
MMRFLVVIILQLSLFQWTSLLIAQNLADTAFFDAINNSDFDLVKEYIEIKKISPNARHPQIGTTALMWAIERSSPEIFIYLLENGADPKIKSLIKTSHPSLNQTIKVGSALNLAIRQGKIGLVKYFIEESKIPVNDRELNAATGREDGLTPLEMVCMTNYSDILEYLLAQGADINVDEGRAFQLSTDSYQASIVKILLQKGFNLDLIKTQYPLHTVCGLEDQDLVDFFLKQGYHINEKYPQTGETPIFRAMRAYIDLDFLKYLYQKGADFFAKNQAGQSLAEVAQANNMTAERLYFVQNPDKPLHQAVFTKNYKKFYEAHQLGKLNELDRQGRTPLNLAQEFAEEFELEALVYFLQNPARMQALKIDLKVGTQLVWAVDYNGEKYDFIVDIKNLRSNLIVLWRMTNLWNHSGIMTITEKALKYAEWQQNYFGSEDSDLLLEDATSIWVSDLVFQSLKAGKITNMAGDREINDLIPRGKDLIPVKINGNWQMLEVITASDAKNQEFYQILNSDEHPVILKMNFGWELVIKEIKLP